VLSQPLELLRQPGELLRSCALLCGGTVLAAAALRKGLLVHAAEGSCERAQQLARASDGGAGDSDGEARAWASCSDARWPAPPWHASRGGGGGQAGLADWRCLAAHPHEEGLLAAGGSAGAQPTAALQLWRLSDTEAPLFVSSLSTGAALGSLRSHSSAHAQHGRSFSFDGGGGSSGGGGGGCVTAVCWDECGTRLAATTAEGGCLLWRCGGSTAPTAQLFPFGAGGAAYSAAFLSPTLVLVGGAGAAAGAIDGGCPSLVLWDTLLPPRAARVAAFAAHAGVQGSAAACASPPPQLRSLVICLGAERGDAAAFDLRAAAASGAAAPLWRTPSASGAPGACLTAWGGWAAAGDRAGEVRLLEARNGRLAQTVANAHGRSSFALRTGGGGSLSAWVTPLLALPGGLLSTGADGCLRLWPAGPAAALG